ncbi:MAG TPA: tRNA (adenosine(37)-N6)-dimethylallyltransferase MiaA [Flavitalea sp.]|nr:tRNA (adenosine(37)-N6)-dimethylallyltransferase MiaA [Flavitalea sp.]
MNQKTVIIIAGPTASGKTTLAIELAKHFRTEIISADSRQCYTEMNIGVAKPSPGQLRAVKHHFIHSHSIHENVNAGTFEQYALHAAEAIFKDRSTVIMAGGTGLYIKAFCEGLDEMPAIDPSLRRQIVDQYNSRGLEWLQQEIKEKDPVYYASGEILNPQRLLRALEVKLSTGLSIRDFQRRQPAPRDFRTLKMVIDLPKEQLRLNINNRVDQMMEQGLLEEARSLLPFRELNALQTVGYTELFEYMDGKLTLDEAVEQIKSNTRKYARRQLTWFRKDPAMRWIAGADPEQWIPLVSSLVSQP